MDLFNLISAPNPSKVKTGLRPRAAHEVSLLTATASRVIDMEDPDAATESSGTPSAVKKSLLDFDNENPASLMTEGKGPEDQAQETVAPEILTSGNMPVAGAASEVIEDEVAALEPRVSKNVSTRRGKSLPMMGLAAGTTFITPTDTKGVNDPDPLSYAEPQPHPEQSMTQSYEISTRNVATMEVKDTRSAKSAGSGKSTFSLSMVGSPEEIYQPGWGVTNSCRLDTPDACQNVVDHIVSPRYFSKLRHMPNIEFLSQYNKNLAQQVAMGSQLRLRFEQEVRLLKKSRAQIARRDQRIQVREKEIKKLDQEIQGLQNQTGDLKNLLEAETDMKKAAETKNDDLTKELKSLREEKIKSVFEEFKKYEDDRVEKRCAKMDACLDALSIDFDEELYPHMLTAIAGRRWVIGHGLRLAVMKCGESTELRLVSADVVFADVVFTGIAKGMSEGLKYGVEHGKANLDLKAIEAYDPEAKTKYVAALHDLRDLKYPMVDQLELLKDAPIDVVMASLHLESDYEEDAPQWIRELRHSSSQLKIPVYSKVRGPKDPWAFKEEILLTDAIAANVSRAEKKKRFRVVCRTHGIGSTHHARSDGVPVLVPTIASQGLAILLADAAIQTETFEDGASPRELDEPSTKPFVPDPLALLPTLPALQSFFKCPVGSSPPSLGMGVVSTYTTLMPESKNSSHGNEFSIANPWTREERMTQKHLASNESCWGFAFDPVINDYKIVFGVKEERSIEDESDNLDKSQDFQNEESSQEDHDFLETFNMNSVGPKRERPETSYQGIDLISDKEGVNQKVQEKEKKSDNEQDHLLHVMLILQKCKQLGIILSKKKAQLFKESINFLGISFRWKEPIKEKKEESPCHMTKASQIQEQDSHSGESSTSDGLTTSPKMVINSPCLTSKKELTIPEQTTTVLQVPGVQYKRYLSFRESKAAAAVWVEENYAPHISFIPKKEKLRPDTYSSVLTSKKKASLPSLGSLPSKKKKKEIEKNLSKEEEDICLEEFEYFYPEARRATEKKMVEEQYFTTDSSNISYYNFIKNSNPLQVYHAFQYGLIDTIYPSSNLQELKEFPKKIYNSIKKFGSQCGGQDKDIFLKISGTIPLLDKYDKYHQSKKLIGKEFGAGLAEHNDRKKTVKILIKSEFRSGINTPIKMALLDNRIESREDYNAEVQCKRVLGTIMAGFEGLATSSMRPEIPEYVVVGKQLSLPWF
uniref:Transposase (Putative), gypsy type n=1 Tax=Tanacetum cinerariifolium TaxID=118510 RepID=A0A699GQW1_TANCI|nr:hypothetical protein [Tanacetum cinerariifolium]